MTRRHRPARETRPDSPVEPGSRGDAEGLDGLEYVTGEVPYRSREEVLLDQEREDESPLDDHRDPEPLEEVFGGMARDESGGPNTSDDVDRQGRAASEERDWYGDMYADAGRGRPSDGTKR